MSKLCRPTVAVLFGILLATTTATAGQDPFALLHSLVERGSNAQAGAGLGVSVAVGGTTAVIGAPFHDAGAARSGVVKVYDATTSALLHTLTNPTPAANDYFGYSVALFGTRVVVGVPLDDSRAADTGSVYVYDLASATPTRPTHTLTNPNPSEESAAFGFSVAIAGTSVVVGAPGADTGATAAGSVYVYDLASAVPALPLLTLTNPSPSQADVFGVSAAISGSRVIVGAKGDNTGAAQAGSAYVYDISNAAPRVPVIVLTNPTPAGADYFGQAVGISGNRAVVGAYLDNTGATDAGSAYVYDLDGATPTLPMLTLTNPSPAVSNYFGSSVAISGTRVLVGAFQDDHEATNAGSAYIFDLANATPTVPVSTLVNPSPAMNDYFGFSVAIDDGGVCLVGAPYDDTAANDSGAAYIFGLRPRLSINPAGRGFATLSWLPTTSSRFVLQYSDSLAPTNWLGAPSGAANPVTLATTNDSRLYRLLQP